MSTKSNGSNSYLHYILFHARNSYKTEAHGYFIDMLGRRIQPGKIIIEEPDGHTEVKNIDDLPSYWIEQIQAMQMLVRGV